MRTPVFRNPDETDWGLPPFTDADIWRDLWDAVRAVFHHLFVQSAETRRLHKDLRGSPGPIRVSVGSGRTVPDDGWVGLDFRKGPRVYRCDLRKPLPFGDGTVDVVLAEHIVEHFWYDDIPAVFDEFFRILRPGGIVRIVCPDALIVCDLLQGKENERTELQKQMDARMHRWQPVEATPLRVANRMAHEFGNHKSLLTEQALVGFAADAGFVGIETMTVDRSVHFASPPGTHLARYPDGILEAAVIEAVHPPSAPN
ncbi:methyltransferase domain-containing protein [Streptomyces sp. NBC_00564]|uniref:class I SAM-dependent methyltransferase n=1 Tax=Streptomyces sp. NBC_00564 TaxID=2903663 RepID=UPI00352EC66B|nr:methyltransferase domain-containing protein [Streptomyces sp. NBC_00564]